MAIISFADDDTRCFGGSGTRIMRFQAFERVAIRKLTALNAAINLDSLAKIPGNRLEALKEDRNGQHSIRINNQWRICFRWEDLDAYDVEINNHYT
jgi:proteic killer suppression protein